MSYQKETLDRIRTDCKNRAFKSFEDNPGLPFETRARMLWERRSTTEKTEHNQIGLTFGLYRIWLQRVYYTYLQDNTDKWEIFIYSPLGNCYDKSSTAFKKLCEKQGLTFHSFKPGETYNIGGQLYFCYGLADIQQEKQVFLV